LYLIILIKLTTNVPYNATVKLTGVGGGSGFNAPESKPYLE
jgi:hypothetical protein